MLNVLLVTLGLARAHRARRPVVRARRVPRRHADRRDRVPLPGRGGHQAVPRRAARAVLHHRRHDARPARRRAPTSAGSLLLLVAPVLAKLVARRRAGARSSARRSRPRCAPASISRRRASSRSCCSRSRVRPDIVPPAFAQPVLAAMILSMLVGAAPDPVRRAARAQAHRQRLARARGAGHADRRAHAWRGRTTSSSAATAAAGRTSRACSSARTSPTSRSTPIPQRVREAAADGSSVVYGDASRREALVSAGLAKARALAITFADTPVGAQDPASRARSCGPDLPVIVRTRRRQRARQADEGRRDRGRARGARGQPDARVAFAAAARRAAQSRAAAHPRASARSATACSAASSTARPTPPTPPRICSRGCTRSCCPSARARSASRSRELDAAGRVEVTGVRRRGARSVPPPESGGSRRATWSCCSAGPKRIALRRAAAAAGLSRADDATRSLRSALHADRLQSPLPQVQSAVRPLPHRDSIAAAASPRPARPMTAAIELTDVTFGYDRRRPVLKGIDMTIPRGKVVAIMGGSGCGKTTILRLIGGQLRPQRGRGAGRRASRCTSSSATSSTRCAGASACCSSSARCSPT